MTVSIFCIKYLLEIVFLDLDIFFEQIFSAHDKNLSNNTIFISGLIMECGFIWLLVITSL